MSMFTTSTVQKRTPETFIEGVPKNDKQAVKWYTKEAEKGDNDAQYNLGNMYENGYGTPQDYKQAVKWYTIAAKQGHKWSQYNLGISYHNGQGVPQDYTTHSSII